MNESSRNLTVRVTLDRSMPPETEPPAAYRWDRIVGALAIVSLLVFLGFRWLWGEPDVAVDPVPSLAESVVTSDVVEPLEIKPVPEAVVAETDQLDVVASAPEIEPNPQPIAANPAKSGPTVERKEAQTNSEAVPVASTTLQAPAQKSPGFVSGRTQIVSPAVVRFLISESVIAKEPAGTLEDIVVDAGRHQLVKLHAFSEVRGLAGDTLLYRWIHRGETVADVRVGVGSSSWRSHSSKYLQATMVGPWRVELKDSGGELLAYTEFAYHSAGFTTE